MYRTKGIYKPIGNVHDQKIKYENIIIYILILIISDVRFNLIEIEVSTDDDKKTCEHIFFQVT